MTDIDGKQPQREKFAPKVGANFLESVCRQPSLEVLVVVAVVIKSEHWFACRSRSINRRLSCLMIGMRRKVVAALSMDWAEPEDISVAKARKSFCDWWIWRLVHKVQRLSFGRRSRSRKKVKIAFRKCFKSAPNDADLHQSGSEEMGRSYRQKGSWGEVNLFAFGAFDYIVFKEYWNYLLKTPFNHHG